MVRLVFDWADEDPGALIVLVLALVGVLFVPWQCNLTDSFSVEAAANTPAPVVEAAEEPPDPGL